MAQGKEHALALGITLMSTEQMCEFLFFGLACYFHS
jgi:hypothetical protein